jgi:CRISPR type III-A-associated RAMP protein Csm4
MQPACIVRLRPQGPWRFGPLSGARDRVESILHSDSVFSAVTSAVQQLGLLDDWLAASNRAEGPAVQLSSLFPFSGRSLFVIPPRNLWPPAPSARLRWKAARFVPLNVVGMLLREQSLQEDRWAVDPVSECLLSTDRNPSPAGPFRIGMRSGAAVDRIVEGNVESHSTACLEFAEGAGIWCLITFADDNARTYWSGRMKAAFRLLADTGMGGERSRGWGRSAEPEFTDGRLPELLFPPSQKLRESAMQARATKSEAAAHSEVPAVTNPETPVHTEPEASSASPEPETSPSDEPLSDLPNASADVSAPPVIEKFTLESPTSEQPASSDEQLGHEPALEPDAAKDEPLPESTATAPAAHATELPPEHAPIENGWWLLSVYTPGPSDAVEWQGGNYSLIARGGRIESRHASGQRKQVTRMVEEGSVLLSPEAPKGAAVNVAPADFPHPVWRAGFALVIPVPWRPQS